MSKEKKKASKLPDKASKNEKINSEVLDMPYQSQTNITEAPPQKSKKRVDLFEQARKTTESNKSFVSRQQRSSYIPKELENEEEDEDDEEMNDTFNATKSGKLGYQKMQIQQVPQSLQMQEMQRNLQMQQKKGVPLLSISYPIIFKSNLSKFELSSLENVRNLTI